ncbi:lysophospholipase [Williamsoniiplasma somnilux]|uniref:Lysophospholipase n=1 Tax=Williamsoniiplasma somnilux TaxID=215578 RepID=A0A2K8NYR8_9MOLU|nr:alpha/beta fold hydrolase [Williamsoniiplasma somnilux]ATZ18947.1 lysophospholipase [Williamsoniiplasma somnilux]
MREFQLRMIDGKELKIYEWTKVEKPIAILQLVHGSAEHALRYRKFAEKMNEHRIIVVADDHRGHGQTADLAKQELGFFAVKNGWTKIVDDLKMVNDYIHKTWNDVPVFMLGHSMGSFMARTYAIKYSETINGAIFMGVAEHNPIELFFGSTLAKIQQLILGPKKPAVFLWKISFKPLNKAFKSVKNANGNEWLTKDEKIQKEFAIDPLSRQIFTTSAFKDMFNGLTFIRKSKNIKLMRKDLPIMIMSGEDDPVGKYGQMPLKIQDKFIHFDYNSELRLYPNSRHEILNDVEKELVINDLIHFIKINLNNL